MGKTTEFIKGAGDSNGDDSINKSISRRDFLKLGLLAGASIAGGALLAGCNNANAVDGLQKPTDIDQTPTDNPMGQNDGGNEIPQGEQPEANGTPAEQSGENETKPAIDGLPPPEDYIDKIKKFYGYSDVIYLGQYEPNGINTDYVYECVLNGETFWATVTFSDDNKEGVIIYKKGYNPLEAQK